MKLFYMNIFVVILTTFFIGPGILLRAEENQKNRQIPPTKHYHVNPATSGIKIDGVLNEEAWQDAVLIELPYEWTPGDNIPALVKTECMVTFSKSKLYVGFRCFDPDPKEIRAHLINRDAIDTFILDDHVQIMLDCFNDERRAFQFRVNPLGVQADAANSEIDDYEDFSWDAIWDSSGKITDFGYTVEMAIPFNQLRFPKTRGKHTWGISADRSYPRNVRHRMCSEIQSRDVKCQLCQFSKITGFEDISPGRNLEFDPTLTLNRTDKRNDFPNEEMESGKIKVEPGVTFKWGVTPNLILNTAVNPDFSNVEADAAQLEVNTRFALRYPEKRPFFLEAADLFLTPLETVFTRTVYDPVWGIKVSGKIRKNALGIFAIQDEYNNLIFPSNQESQFTSIKENVYGGVFRFRRDIGKNSTLGILYTGRFNDNYYNHVAGADAFIRLSNTKNLSFQFLNSQTLYPEEISRKFNQPADSFGGNAWFIRFANMGRYLTYFLEYEDLDANFRADFGYIPRVDMHRLGAGISPIIWGKKGQWFNKITLELRGEKITNHAGQLTNQDILVTASYDGPLQTIFNQSFAIKKEFYNGITYDIKEFHTYLNMKPAAGLNAFISSKYGDAVDYVNSRLAHSVQINPGIELSLGKHLNINLNHLFERFSLEGKKIYNANLLQTRFIYNFNIRTFIRAIFQYTHIDRSMDLYILPVESVTKELFTQFLFSYQINPQTVLFIGYSDNSYGTQFIDVTVKDRTFFLKIGYALCL